MTGEEDDRRLERWLTRVEGKLDVAITRHDADIEGLKDDVKDHEDRLRTQEQRPVVSPRHIYMGITLACVILGAMVSVLTLAG